MIVWWAAFVVAGVLGVLTAAWLASGAVASWRRQRAGLVYELTPRYRGTVLRGGAALLVVGAVLAAGTGMVASGGGEQPTPNAGRTVPADPGLGARPVATGSATTALVTTGHPSGGELLQGELPGVAQRVQVWLPQQYPARSGLLPVLLVRADEAHLDDVFDALAASVTTGRSTPFVLVAPVTPTAACDRGPGGAGLGDAVTLRHALADRFRVQSAARYWGLLGLDGGAACAVGTEIAHPEDYLAAAGIGGSYDALTPSAALPSPALPSPALPSAHSATGAATAATSSAVRLLLADAHRDTAGQDSAARLHIALARRPHADVRLSSVVRDFTVQRERFRLIRLAAGYLTEQLGSAG
ncbi:hypothetical protein [Streptacidiphilus sp. EB129]|uniref:hypothetical protein n=1 Tax=Streptacidiphilus sp. EB129 TaxID=3156262 RepID=UPI0035112735